MSWLDYEGIFSKGKDLWAYETVIPGRGRE